MTTTTENDKIQAIYNEVYPNIDNEITPDLKELQREKDDIIREYTKFLLEQKLVTTLEEDNIIIGRHYY